MFPLIPCEEPWNGLYFLNQRFHCANVVGFFFTNGYLLSEVLTRKQSKKAASIIDEGKKDMVGGSAKCIERANLDMVIE